MARKKSPEKPADSTDFARKVAARLEELMVRHPGLRPGRSALIGVSGGRDSVALLHALVCDGWKKLRVVHLNHGLRGRDSEKDAAFVRSLAKALGLRCEIGKVNVAKLAAREKISVETAGRNARREFFLRMARRHRCHAVFVAHHAEDQAETVLHNLFRGAALRGASGMAPVSLLGKSLLLVRPALDTSREEIDAHMAVHGLKHREDGSNASLEFTRNRVRHELLPLLDDIFRREVSPIITRFAEQARQEDEFLQSIADGTAKSKGFILPDGSLKISAPFQKQHPALQARVLRDWLAAKGPRIGNREVHAVLVMIRRETKSKINLPGGARLSCDGRRLWWEPSAKSTRLKSKSPRQSTRR